jgi:uncharacterized protein (UPF0261 family)
MSALTILLIGTADTKADELGFLRDCLRGQGAQVLVMDVGVGPAAPLGWSPEIGNEEVAQAGGSSLQAIAGCGDENTAMAQMAAGATALALRLFHEGRVQGVLALGGTMGTDLALDVTAALPLGCPKMIVTTVAFSHLIPPERLAPDLIMMLWAGGLYGLNDICRTILSQAAGAIVGAGRAAALRPRRAPTVAISSLGKSCLKYMVALKPALEARGYEVAVFHCTGMGGRALESLARQGRFAAVLDLCLQELGNEAHGSVVTSGPGRLAGAGELGVPQIVAPGGLDMIDLQAWKPLPLHYEGRPYHAHNRLIASVAMTPDERRAAARLVAQQLALAQGPTAFVLPRGGIEAWDLPGESLHDPEGLAAFCDEIRKSLAPPVQLIELDAHINDAAFSEAVLQVFDDWVGRGLIAPGLAASQEAA